MIQINSLLFFFFTLLISEVLSAKIRRISVVDDTTVSCRLSTTEQERGLWGWIGIFKKSDFDSGWYWGKQVTHLLDVVPSAVPKEEFIFSLTASGEYTIVYQSNIEGTWALRTSKDFVIEEPAEELPVIAVPSSNLKVIIPLYSTPCSAAWTELAQIALNSNIQYSAVVNPNSGPGTVHDPQYTQCMQDLKNAGVRLFGYVHTKLSAQNIDGSWVQYGFRTQAAVENDIDLWSSMYGQLLDGIFLDEVSNIYQSFNSIWDEDHVARFQVLIDYSASVVGPVILNAGSAMDSSLVGNVNVDTALLFEGLPTTFIGPCLGFSPGIFCPYHRIYDAVDNLEIEVRIGEHEGKVGALIFGATLEEMEQAIDIATTSMIDTIYVTDRTLGNNPWSGLSTYFTEFDTKLQSVMV